MFKLTKDIEGKMETMIGAESQFQGSLRSKGSLRVDGRLEGNVMAESVIVGDQGEVQGDISAKHVVVGGKVTGNITASSSLELQTHCRVYGDLKTAQLTIAEGAVYEGNCIMATEKSKEKEPAVHLVPKQAHS